MEQPFLDRRAITTVCMKLLRMLACSRPKLQQTFWICFARRPAKRDNSGMKWLHVSTLALIAISSGLLPLHARDKQPAGVFHARRVALAAKLNGGVAVLFAAEEAQLDFMPYRQDSDFYYLTGWNEPGAALLIVSDAPSFSPRAICAWRSTPAKRWMRPRRA